MKSKLLVPAVLSAMLGLQTAGVSAADKTVLVVLAASSAKAAMTEVAATFEKAHPDASVQISYAGSKVIASEVAQGAAADVVLLSDVVAKDMGGIGGTVPVSRNHSTILVASAAAAKIHSAADLVKKGIRLGGGTPGSNLGHFNEQTIANIAKQLGADYPSKFAANVTTTKTSNAALAQALISDSIDAAILFASDVVPGKMVEVPLTEQQRVYEVQDVAVVTASAHGSLAKQFAALVSSPEGAAIFLAHHHDSIK